MAQVELQLVTTSDIEDITTEMEERVQAAIPQCDEETITNDAGVYKVMANGLSYNDLQNKPEIPTVYASTEEPTQSQGKNGDIWFVIEE